jgi:acetolactate synthase regulatory subunit
MQWIAEKISPRMFPRAATMDGMKLGFEVMAMLQDEAQDSHGINELEMVVKERRSVQKQLVNYGQRHQLTTHQLTAQEADICDARQRIVQLEEQLNAALNCKCRWELVDQAKHSTTKMESDTEPMTRIV